MPKIRIKEPDQETKSFSIKIDREVVNIGRHGDCMIQLTDDSISSEHVVIKRVVGGFVLYDQESTNGTKMDGDRYTIIDLNKTKHFTLGDVQVSFILSDEDISLLQTEEFSSEESKIIGIKKEKNEETLPTNTTEDDEKDYQDEEWDEEAGSAFSGFVITVIAFLVTIILLLLGLFLTGHLKF